eukprot:6187289-Pleurochrysis_carterae.AAC.2
MGRARRMRGRQSADGISVSIRGPVGACVREWLRGRVDAHQLCAAGRCEIRRAGTGARKPNAQQARPASWTWALGVPLDALARAHQVLLGEVVDDLRLGGAALALIIVIVVLALLLVVIAVVSKQLATHLRRRRSKSVRNRKAKKACTGVGEILSGRVRPGEEENSTKAKRIFVKTNKDERLGVERKWRERTLAADPLRPGRHARPASHGGAGGHTCAYFSSFSSYSGSKVK